MVEKKYSFGSFLRDIVLWFVVAIVVFPFLHMIAVSFSDVGPVTQGKVALWPLVGDGKLGATLDVYKYVLGTVIALFVLATGAYALSKPDRLPGGKVMNLLVLFTMFFGGGMIPSFLCMQWLGLVDTIWAIVLPHAFGAYNCIVMRSFFKEFPKEIEESGKLDGLNDIGILWYLVLPTSTAVLATIGLFVAVSQWNGFFGPLIYLNDNNKYPLQIILRQVVLAGTKDDMSAEMGAKAIFAENSIKFATIAVAVVPIIAVYPFLQKYFVKGVMIGSVKG